MLKSIFYLNQIENQKTFKGIIGLLSSGIFAAIAFTIIASNRLPQISKSEIIFLLLFVQWQTLGLTIVKMGIDQLVFAAVSIENHLFFSFGRFFLTRAFPCCLCFGITASFVFTSLTGLVLSL